MDRTTTPFGLIALLLLAGVLMGLGVFVMKRMISFKI